jgi:hypothetical protein
MNRRIKIAVDTGVPRRRPLDLQRRFIVVARAGHREPDASWIERGLKKGARVFASPDRRVIHEVEKQGKKGVYLPLVAGFAKDLIWEYINQKTI